MLRRAWLPLGVAVVLVGLLADVGPLIGLGVLLLLAGGVAWAWARRALERVVFERLLPESRAFPGDTLRLTYRLANRKRLPVPSIEVRDRLPEALSPPDLGLPPSAVVGSNTYTHTTQLGWHERVSWSLDLPCPTRGFYRLGPARLRSGDAFGLYASERDEPSTGPLVVYPRTGALHDLGLPAARPLGELRGALRLFEDPLRAAGVRDYQQGDPIRRIDWKATARRGELQSRVYEPSATRHLIVALNIDTLEHPWEGYVPELLEAGIVVAASIARWAYDARYAVGLLANGSLPDSDRPINIPPGRSGEQLSRILEALAGIGPLTITPLAAVLERVSHALPFGATTAVVTALMPEPLAAVLRRLHASGQQVVVISTTGEGWWGLLGDVPLHRAAVEGIGRHAASEDVAGARE